jgi:hypothetical protein
MVNLKVKGKKIESLSKFVGGKIGRGEKVFFLHITLATKHWNNPLATKF